MPPEAQPLLGVAADDLIFSVDAYVVLGTDRTTVRRLRFRLIPWRSQSIEPQAVSVVRQSADTCKACRQNT
jgi:hypothetical protein